ncbi:NAD-dependent epimerase/dehydratase family protein [Nodularia harveyana UHCC-0300]|uniref:NAD-dependent epimerase/dehydratase family protein n=1 Tax=Nodularia harveyana UHCC-0300 TaxID=2974287 RepID=A0ABU5UI64_9CYAN|nr:NAD-dependent epimerase/dehydratase family protein [Nodularia harveyana]MEA5583190.1 NAD-dependent epimerase/dehydratase family protein [Nodularia harveyana UHCC-0300]
MHFIITGGAGFIGSHLTDELLLTGHQVTVVDNFMTGFRHNLPEHSHLQFVEKDICECQPQDFTKPIDGIFHLAAASSVQKSWLNPLETHHHNLSSTMAVVQICEALGIPRLVFTSSAAVYGNPTQLPLRETHSTNPISPYGLHKLMGEQYIDFFAKNNGFSAVILRLFNVFGDRQSPKSPYSGVISLFSSAIQQGLPIKIYGDGTQKRDFIYVKDVVNALIQAVKTPLSFGNSLTCNIGLGKRTSLLEILTILQEYYPQKKVPIEFAPMRQGDIHDSWANIDNAREILGFSPPEEIKPGLSSYLTAINFCRNLLN